MNSEQFEGLIRSTFKGNNADLEAFVDRLSHEYLIVRKRFVSPLLLSVDIAPATDRNLKMLRQREIDRAQAASDSEARLRVTYQTTND